MKNHSNRIDELIKLQKEEEGSLLADIKEKINDFNSTHPTIVPTNEEGSSQIMDLERLDDTKLMIRFDYIEYSIEIRGKEKRKLTDVQLGMGLKTDNEIEETDNNNDEQGGRKYLTKRIPVNVEDIKKYNLLGIVTL